MGAQLRLLALAAATTIACTGSGRTAGSATGSSEAPPAGSSAGSAAAPVAVAVAAATPVVVQDRAGADAQLGKPAVVRGTAKNAKLAAAIVAGDLVVYCLGVASWPSSVANRAITARGTLEHTSEFSAPAGDEASAGTSGPVYVLRTCAYEPQ